ncbi:c-type cytochrome [Polyangium sp. y55x31]|uniref:c-type cytochrome n=1 Tax=Polyangium sp. y55x31 TaxID=3042688 RepID=UPI00248318B0|nr:c-type cytochrome [Polyangium sp. y55x31]MDI1475455.1 c-type cytochrome [Polyangium sp. y55x31]
MVLSRRYRSFLLLLALTAPGALAACKSKQAPQHEVAGGDAARGREAIKKYACGACHVIPGVEGAIGKESHPLWGFANRGDIAHVAPNTPDNLIRWIRRPTDLAPRTKMPTLGVSEQEAKDIAAYLYTLNGE